VEILVARVSPLASSEAAEQRVRATRKEEPVQQPVDLRTVNEGGRGAQWKAAGRSILAVLAGVIVGGVLIAAVEAVSSVVYPLPPGVDHHDYESLRQHVEQLPLGAFLFVLAAWAIGTFAGAWVAASLATRARFVHGLVVGAFFLLAGVLNMLMIPHPAWMWAGALLVFVVCSYLGARLAAPAYRAAR
jgi:MFS family permease